MKRRPVEYRKGIWEKNSHGDKRRETTLDNLVKDNHRRGKKTRKRRRDSRNFYSFFLKRIELACHRSPDLIYQNHLKQQEGKDLALGPIFWCIK